MKIILNNETIALNGTTIADLIAQTSPQEPFAVAISTQLVAEGAYAETVLDGSDKMDIIRPVVSE